MVNRPPAEFQRFTCQAEEVFLSSVAWFCFDSEKSLFSGEEAENCQLPQSDVCVAVRRPPAESDTVEEEKFEVNNGGDTNDVMMMITFPEGCCSGSSHPSASESENTGSRSRSEKQCYIDAVAAAADTVKQTSFTEDSVIFLTSPEPTFAYAYDDTLKQAETTSEFQWSLSQ